MLSTYDFYPELQQLADSDDRIDEVCIGHTWTYARRRNTLGLAQTPGLLPRTFAEAGSLSGRSVASVVPWLTDWDLHRSTLALAAVNAVVNTRENDLMRDALALPLQDGSGNLSVFAYFREHLVGQKTLIIGRYPGLDTCLGGLDYTVLERHPGPGDLPDTAAERLLPAADWVFLTATAIINQTLPRLLELAANAVTVLLGPSTPWWSGWQNYHVDFIAGVRVRDDVRARQVIREGGGTALFEGAVEYAVADLSEPGLQSARGRIKALVDRRNDCKGELEACYAEGKRASGLLKSRIDELDRQLAQADLRYKRLWDAKQRCTE